MNDVDATDAAGPAVNAALGFDVEIGCLRAMIVDWVAGCHEEMRAALEWQFLEIFPAVDGLLLLPHRPRRADPVANHELGAGRRILPQRLADHRRYC
jgi:hypothetical protein